MDKLSTTTVRLPGSAELLGGVLLVVPAAFGVAGIITPIAAVGLILLLSGALDSYRQGMQSFIVTAVLFLGVAIVAWGRFGPWAL